MRLTLRDRRFSPPLSLTPAICVPVGQQLNVGGGNVVARELLPMAKLDSVVHNIMFRLLSARMLSYNRLYFAAQSGWLPAANSRILFTGR
jgi:hypothetical protein